LVKGTDYLFALNLNICVLLAHIGDNNIYLGRWTFHHTNECDKFRPPTIIYSPAYRINTVVLYLKHNLCLYSYLHNICFPLNSSCCVFLVPPAGRTVEPLPLWRLSALHPSAVSHPLDQREGILELRALLLQVPGPGHQHQEPPPGNTKGICSANTHQHICGETGKKQGWTLLQNKYFFYFRYELTLILLHFYRSNILNAGRTCNRVF